eukprot:TRINITY_DN46170_c0_g1_i1.p1 TRINITY_DN46170_c0_g1~~TRINITY_DN46170_c0_g1_i1.p1  ORF type:complete len:151 (+),score=16.58 TRINITY_DN46170_c0_g1_i1:62-514(+)
MIRVQQIVDKTLGYFLYIYSLGPNRIERAALRGSYHTATKNCDAGLIWVWVESIHYESHTTPLPERSSGRRGGDLHRLVLSGEKKTAHAGRSSSCFYLFIFPSFSHKCYNPSQFSVEFGLLILMFNKEERKREKELKRGKKWVCSKREKK